MKKLTLVFAAVLCFSTMGLTGCGGHTEKVVESPDESNKMTGEQKSSYEADMKKQQGQQGN